MDDLRPYKKTFTFKFEPLNTKPYAKQVDLVCSLTEAINMATLGGRTRIMLNDLMRNHVIIGKRLHSIDECFYESCHKNDIYPASLGYEGFPKSLCINPNEIVAHGLPLYSRTVKSRDIIGIDVVTFANGVFVDVAETKIIDPSKSSGETRKMVNCTKEALEHAIRVCKPNTKLNHPALIFEKHAIDNGFKVVPNLNSHFIKTSIHGNTIYNRFNKNESRTFKEGMSFTLEPIFCLPNARIVSCQDGIAYKTHDNSPSTHFEHTIIMTDTGAVPLTAG